MGWLSDLGKSLDPTGNNFLGLGPTTGRVISGVFTAGADELNRPDPFGTGRNTGFAKSIGGFTTGAAAGAGTGFLVGGPWGAVFGAVIGGVGGAVAGATGATKNYTVKGFAENTGIGVGGGLLGGGAAHLAVVAAPTVGPSLPSLPSIASPSFTFGSLKGLATALGGGALLQKLLTPQQLQNLGLPQAATDAVAKILPKNLTPSTNVSSYLLPPPIGGNGAGGTTVIAVPGQPAAAQSSYLWLIILIILVGAYLYFKKKRHH